jgi:protein phosphatase
MVMLFRDNRVYIANVGDSRGYRIRRNKMEQMTTDHSLVGEQIRAGMIRPKEAKEHRLKNIITRSVGFQEAVEVDVEARAVKAGDIYLLCSDGLYNMVEDDEILDVFLHHDLKEGTKHLVDIANSRGGDDNITLVLAKVVSLEKQEDGPEDEESTLQC